MRALNFEEIIRKLEEHRLVKKCFWREKQGSGVKIYTAKKEKNT